MSDEQQSLNKDYIINSLRNQLSNANVMIAEREALIEQLGQENKQLKESKTPKK